MRSNAIFICTANDTSTIDRPLLDRMEVAVSFLSKCLEVIDLSGYTVEEKACFRMLYNTFSTVFNCFHQISIVFWSWRASLATVSRWPLVEVTSFPSSEDCMPWRRTWSHSWR